MLFLMSEVPLQAEALEGHASLHTLAIGNNLIADAGAQRLAPLPTVLSALSQCFTYCATVQVYKCTSVQLCNCTTVQLFNCTTVQLYNCSTVQMYKCTTVQLYNCTTVRLYNCTTVQLYNCTTVQLYNCTTHCVQLYNSLYN